MSGAKKICWITGGGLVVLALVFVVMAFTSGGLLTTTYLVTAGGLVLGALICVATGSMIGGLGGDSKLLQTGMPGTATIMSLQETGMVVNYTNQVLNIGLRVQVGTGAPYDVTVRQMVPMMLMARCQPGAVVGVKVDPQNQNKVAIDWSMVPGVNMNPAPAPSPLPPQPQQPYPQAQYQQPQQQGGYPQ